MTSLVKIIALSLGMALAAVPAFVADAAFAKPSKPKVQAPLTAKQKAEKVAAILAAHPRGGERMETALANLVIIDPSYAQIVADAASIANTAQISSIGEALGRAEAVLAASKPQAAALVAAAIQTAPPAVQSAAVEGKNQVVQSQIAAASGGQGGDKGSGGDKPNVLTPTTSGGSGGGSVSQ